MADNNIVIKITSEADLNSAQKAIKDLTDKAKEQERALHDLSDAEKEDAKSIKDLGLSEEQLAKALKKNKDYYRDLRDQKKGDISNTKKSIKELENQVKAYKTLNGMSGKVVQQLRAMREELQRMEDAGEFGTQAFIDLSIKASELEDKIGDLQTRIRILASDTKNMDAIMGLGDGLAGGFYIATSTAELLGDELEGLQKAFYKVQAAMSVVSGTQQVYNALQKDSNFQVVFNTAVEKINEKAKNKQTASLVTNTAAWWANGKATAGASVKLALHTAATKIATVAQAALNAVIYANPFVLLAAGAAAAAAAILYFATRNKEASDAADQFKEANKKLEATEAKLAIGAEQRAHDRQVQIRETNDAEEKALFEAKKRNASEIELAAIKSKYAKQREEEAKKYANDEIKRNKILKAQAWVAMQAKRDEANAYKEGSKKQKQALNELAEAEQKYYEYVNKITDLENERKDADKASADAAQELAQARKQMALEAEQANVELMKEGASKEIAQINLNYREKLKTLKGKNKEVVALRKALLEQQEKEIAEVQRKYDLQAQQVAVQEKRNLLKAMSQSRGTEADYAKEIALTKAVAEQEAQVRIAALDKEKMAEDDYAAQVEAIELELKDTLKRIDDDEANRKAENARRLTEIELKEAEARKNALTGAEGVDEQKAILEDYYATRKKQIEENARLEKESVERSTKTEEEKAAEIKAIEANLQSDLKELKKEGSQAMLDVDAQYLSDLELAVSKAESNLSAAAGNGTQLQSLRERYEAQMMLYAEQQKQLKSQYDAGLISYQDYKNQEWEITKAITDAEVQYQTEAIQTITDGFQTALGYMQEISDLAFEALGNNVQAEMDALDKMYTTDWQEAQKNADKKYITEKEYEKKKAELEMKQAKYAKAQALINAAINTATAIVTTLAQLGATPWGIAASVLAGTMGAAQIGIIAAKPLAQYEKGRKGGKGEYALVGEKGPEIMYVPQDASIVPNNLIATPEAWSKFGVPELPHANPEILHFASEQSAFSLPRDFYDKIGASVASRLPAQRNVTVNVDSSGVHVNNGGDNHTYLNAKYCGSWS